MNWHMSAPGVDNIWKAREEEVDAMQWGYASNSADCGERGDRDTE